MGYQTNFYGAFRIFPKLNPAFACRLNLWFNARHYQRALDVALSQNAGADASDVTLFGNPGKHNEFYMPSFRQALENLMREGMNPAIAPHLVGTTINDNIVDSPFSQPNQTAERQAAYNNTPENIPSLWSNIIIVNDPETDCSYLGWDQVEKSYEMEIWFRCVVNLLQQLGFAVDGNICAYGEDPGDIWGMNVSCPAELVETLEDFLFNLDKDTHEKKYGSRDNARSKLRHKLTNRDFDKIEEILTGESQNGNEQAKALLANINNLKQNGLPFVILSGHAGEPTYQDDFMAAMKRSFDAAKKSFDKDALLKQMLETNPISQLPGTVTPDEVSV